MNSFMPVTNSHAWTVLLILILCILYRWSLTEASLLAQSQPQRVRGSELLQTDPGFPSPQGDRKPANKLAAKQRQTVLGTMTKTQPGRGGE